jgi:hypothetical protein
VPKEPVFQSEYKVLRVGPKDSGSKNFSFLASKKEAVGVTQISYSTGNGIGYVNGNGNGA